MKLSVGKNKIFTFLFFALFLDAYCFFSIGNRSITLWYVGAFFLIAYSIVKWKGILKCIQRNPYTIIMLLYMCINCIITNPNSLSSFLVGMVCWLFYTCSFRKADISEFEKTVSFFQKGMNILAVYGIYQVIAYFFNLPFANPRIEGFMVEGYNWGNYINIAGLHIRRANAIFREPSFFSQFLAINLLIYVQLLLSNQKSRKKKIFINMAINFAALILSFSGTGLLMLLIGTIILLFSNKKIETIKFIRKYTALIVVVALVIMSILFVPNPLKDYLIGRTLEFNSGNTSSVSGYIRMVFPYQVAKDVLFSKNGLIGLGIGNAQAYASNIKLISGRVMTNTIQPILPRTMVEEGIIGTIILFLFFTRIYDHKNLFLPSYKAILIGTLIMSFMHGTWSSEVYWLLLGFLNAQFISEPSSGVETKPIIN